MIVAIDVTHLRQSGGGIARYIRGLIDALSQRPDVIVVPIGGGPTERAGTLRKKLLTARLDLAWYPLLGRRRARGEGAEIYHCPAPRGPLNRGQPPVVMTVHDLVPFRIPDTMTRWSRLYSRATHARMANAADLVVCPSNDTARDVTSYLGVPPERIRVIPLGVDPIFFATEQRAEDRANPYILFVGTQERRKNLERLQKAVGILRSRGFPHSLVIAGGDSWGNVALDRDFVRKLGRVSEDELRDLYAGASCLALPSLHEGFGLPALEAMASGVPVVAGRAGALPEITGSAAVLVDPLDISDIAKGLELALARRAELSAAGLSHAENFTWRKTADATVGVYRELT